MAKIKKTILHNIANQEDYTHIQQEVLNKLAGAVSKSFGPYGTNTAISKKQGPDSVYTIYTKDGHTIVENTQFQDVIEITMKSQLEEINRNIKVKVGDGSTSATILAACLFSGLKELANNNIPYKVMNSFKNVVNDMITRIEDRAVDFTPELAYQIAMVATNQDEEAANVIKDIYEKHGSSVHLDALPSTSDYSMVKEYDGLTINSGFGDSAFINMVESNKCFIQKPRIYVFKDPVDTPAMGAILDKIIQDNIFNAIAKQSRSLMVPTVVLMPRVSRDFTAYLDKLGSLMRGIEGIEKPPIVLIPNVVDNGVFDVIVSLLGAKPIMKYIDPKLYEKDLELGLACNGENVHSFAGTCEHVEVDSLMTKFVKPAEMFDKEDPSKFSKVYESKIEMLKSEIDIVEKTDHDKAKLGVLKKQLHGLQCNMVEYYVGGISPTERDYRLRLIKDAVLNCRSAAKNGVGFGCNFEAFKVINEMLAADVYKDESLKKDILEILDNAYREVLSTLYTVSGIKKEMFNTIFETSLKENLPLNVVTEEFDSSILSSIKSDVVILESIAKILTVVITCNQFLCPDFMFNKYTLNIVD